MKVHSVSELAKAARKLHYRTDFQGLPISIENRKGSKRHWHDPKTGEDGTTTMEHPYGYIRGYTGRDGDDVDVFMGPSKKSKIAFIINQRQTTDFRKFDEHKIMLGFDDLKAARTAYLRHYDKRGRQFMGSIRMWTVDRLKRWLDRGNLQMPAAKMSKGERYEWKTLGGKTHAGQIVEVDSNVLIVDCDDGVRRAVDGDEETLQRLSKAGPYIGPRGGKWADPAHTVPWKEAQHPHAGKTHTVYLDTTSSKKQPSAVILESKVAQLLKRKDGSRLRIPATPGVHEMALRDLEGVVATALHEVTPMKSKEDITPIEVAVYGSGRIQLLDGNHRLLAARKGNVRSLPVKWYFQKALTADLTKAAPSGKGWQSIPKGRKGGFRRKTAKGWEYWYPEAAAQPKWTEAQFASGDFDKDPAHWQEFHKVKGLPAIGWTRGGIVENSRHPVKEAGLPHRLYQIVDAHADKGWAKLRDLSSGEERLVAHDRVIPVFHEVRKAKPTKAKQVWAPGEQPPEEPGVSVASSTAKRTKVFHESRAKKGTAVHDMEHGVFLRHKRVIIETDESGNKVRSEQMKTEVDNQTKEKLLAEFGMDPKTTRLGGMFAKVATEARNRFGLKARWVMEPGKRRYDQTLLELRMAAMEGFLVAVERYPGGLPFAVHAKLYAREHARMHAAKEFSGGIAIPKMHARLLSKYIAARVEAVKALGKEEPSPEEVALFWNIKKRDLHSGLERKDPQRNELVPMRGYKLKIKALVPTEGGKKKTVTLETDTKEQVGKLEWAHRMHSFLTGQKTAQGSEFFEGEGALFPTVHMGVGLSVHDKVDIRSSAGKLLGELEEHELTIESGRQAIRYRANTSDIVQRMLGLTGDLEEQSLQSVATAITIERRIGAADEWKPIGQRQKERILTEFLEAGLKHLQRGFKEQDKKRAAGLVARAQGQLVPTEKARSGPTWAQRVEAQGRGISTEQVREWRSNERGRLRRLRDRMLTRSASMPAGPDRDHQEQLARGVDGALRRISAISSHEVRQKISQSRASETTPEIRRMQTRIVDVGIRKSEDVFVDTTRWPRLTALLADANSIPTRDRFVVEALVGLH